MRWEGGVKGGIQTALGLVEFTMNTHLLRPSLITSALCITFQNKKLNKGLFINILTMIIQLLICVTIKLVLSTCYMPSI